MTIQVDIYEGTGNHGCTNSITVSFASPLSRTGRVVAAIGCSSCWQIGHSQWDAEQYEAYHLGRTVRLVGMAARRFAAYVAEIDDRSHGKLAEDCPRIGYYSVR